YFAGIVRGAAYRTLRLNSDVSKDGDTGTSGVEAVRAVLYGRADAGASGSPFWRAVDSWHRVPEGALHEVWISPPYVASLSRRSPWNSRNNQKLHACAFGDLPAHALSFKRGRFLTPEM